MISYLDMRLHNIDISDLAVSFLDTKNPFVVKDLFSVLKIVSPLSCSVHVLQGIVGSFFFARLGLPN